MLLHLAVPPRVSAHVPSALATSVQQIFLVAFKV